MGTFDNDITVFFCFSICWMSRSCYLYASCFSIPWQNYIWRRKFVSRFLYLTLYFVAWLRRRQNIPVDFVDIPLGGKKKPQKLWDLATLPLWVSSSAARFHHNTAALNLFSFDYYYYYYYIGLQCHCSTVFPLNHLQRNSYAVSTWDCQVEVEMMWRQNPKCGKIQVCQIESKQTIHTHIVNGVDRGEKILSKSKLTK